MSIRVSDSAALARGEAERSSPPFRQAVMRPCAISRAKRGLDGRRSAHQACRLFRVSVVRLTQVRGEGGLHQFTRITLTGCLEDGVGTAAFHHLAFLHHDEVV